MEVKELDEEKEAEQPVEDDFGISDIKVRKLQNLKMFKGWSAVQVREYFKNRDPKAPTPPEKPFTEDDPEVAAELEYNKAEYEKKYQAYMKKYRKEYDTDMNDSNDVQALESLVRLTLQGEVIDENIRRTQSRENFDSRHLKNLGDFQRSIQQSINELQEKLGISRKTRRDRQADDFPAYVRQIQKRAADFWQRKTLAVKCGKCEIELARYWLNFPDNTQEVQFEIVCEKCREKVVYSL